MNTHKLLKKQISKLLPEELKDHADIKKLLAAVNDSYNAFERDRELADRAFHISEEEYIEINKRLKHEIEVKHKSVEKIKETIGIITGDEKSSNSDDLLLITRYLNQQVNKRKDAELVFTSLITNMQSAVLLEDETRHIVFTNQHFCDMFGIPVPPVSLQGVDCSDSAEQSKHLFKDPEGFVSAIGKILSEKKLVTGEILELVDGRIYERDYIPIFLQDKYKGHFWSYTDVTSEKEAQNAIEKSEHTNRLIMNSALDAIIIINEKAEITFWNPQAEKIFGWKEREILGKRLSETIVPDSYRAEHDRGMNHFHATGNGPVLNKLRELIAIDKNGKEFPIELSMVEVKQGELIFFCGFIRDISERKKAEEELKRLSLVASSNNSGVLFTDATGKITWANEGYVQQTGYHINEILGKTPIELNQGPLSDVNEINSMREAFYMGNPFDVEIVHYRKDESWYWGRSKGQAIKDEKGIVTQYFAIMEDITNEKLQEEQLQILSSIAEQNTNPVTICDSEGKAEWVNASFEKMTGYSLNEIKGYRPWEFLQGKDTNSEALAYLRKQMRSGDPFSCEIVNYHKSGTPYWLRIHGQSIKNAKGEIIKYFAIQQNITIEKESAEKVREAEQLWQFALEGAGDGVWEYDLENRVSFYSKQYKQMLGYEEHEFKNESSEWLSRIHPDDISRIEQTNKDYAEGKISSHHREYRVRHRDGHYLWILDRGVVIKYQDNGKPKLLVGTHTNISHIKQTEEELSQRAKQFKSLAENTPGVIYEYEIRKDGTEGLRYLSPSIEKIFGIKSDDYFQLKKFVHPEDAARIKAKNKHSKETLEPYHDESRLIVPGRGIIWRSVTSSFSYYTPEGSAVFTGFMLDITERKNIEQALMAREEKYRSIIANMHLGLLEVDTEEKILFANQSFCEMSGYSLEELLGKKASELFLREENNEAMETRNEMRKKGHSDAYEICVKNKRGEIKWWLISGAPRFNDKGELLGSIGIHLNITAQKEQEYELLDARKQAESSATAKQTFLANMSHEIRTPMNAILGMSRQLQKTELDEKQHLYLQTINEAGENLLVIINDILDISKIEEGKLNLERIGFQMSDVINRAMQVMRHRTEEKGLKLISSFDEKIAGILLGDPYRLNQVLLNLLSNSIKFSEKGTVSIHCKLIGEGISKQVIQISVTDNGIGMEKEFLDNIFQSFTQEDRSVSRKYGGTGLGMSISKQLVELMGGEINVESEKAVGTSFIITIPFTVGEMSDLPLKEIKNTDSRILKNKKILLVEDNEMNRMVATTALSHYGAMITEVVNGAEAVEAVREIRYDLILMDMQMPVMNGLEATELIRKELKSDIPIIALTANAIKGENDKCIEAGMNGYISKPFIEEELVNLMAKWLGVNEVQVKQNNIVLSDQLYDLSKIREISRGNDAFVKKMIALFVDQVPASMEEIHAAFQRNDFAIIKAVAHRIKPSIDNMGINCLKNEIRKIETMALENRHSKDLTFLIQKVDVTLKKVIEELKAEPV